MKCSCCWFRSLPSGLSAACPVASDVSSQRRVSDQLRFHGWSCQRQSHRRVRALGQALLKRAVDFFSSHSSSHRPHRLPTRPAREYSLTCSRREVCQSPKTALEADPSPVKEVTDARATRRTTVSPRQDERRQWGVAHCRRKRHGNPERSKSSCWNKAGTSRTA